MVRPVDREYGCDQPGARCGTEELRCGWTRWANDPIEANPIANGMFDGPHEKGGPDVPCWFCRMSCGGKTPCKKKTEWNQDRQEEPSIKSKTSHGPTFGLLST
jgi:hypothetical protein